MASLTTTELLYFCFIIIISYTIRGSSGFGGAYIPTGEFTRDVMIACALALPMMVPGIFIGNHIHANLNDVAFKRLMAVILIISGLPLLIW